MSFDMLTRVFFPSTWMRSSFSRALIIKAEKCNFHSTSASFLEFVVQQGQLLPYPAEVNAVMDWPSPYSRKQFRFFGLIFAITSFMTVPRWWHLLPVLLPPWDFSRCPTRLTWHSVIWSQCLPSLPSCQTWIPAVSSWSQWMPHT